jgi:hypothetical protein
MSNMHYCQFENTFRDLQQCANTLEEDGVKRTYATANQYEKSNIIRLIELCREIADNYGDELDNIEDMDEDEIEGEEEFED